MPDKHALVTIAELAERLGMDRSHARRFILKAGFEFLRTRTAASRRQLTLALSQTDAATVYRIRAERGFNGDRPSKAAKGRFYVIIIAPEMDARRVKLGYADDVDNRLATYRTLSPSAKVVASWPCKRVWEAAALDFVGKDCERIGQEVYLCKSIKAIVRAGERFFAMAPEVKS